MEIKIGQFQFFVLVALYVSGGAMLIIPAIAASEAGQDAWISILLSLLAGLALIPLYAKLNAKFPGQTIVQYSDHILGKIAGKTVSVIFLSTAFILCATLM